jgi:hypothetical protein
MILWTTHPSYILTRHVPESYDCEQDVSREVSNVHDP